jgi:hypothetical protein
MMRFTAAAAAFTAVGAQDWGTTGSWQIQQSTNVNGPYQTLRKAYGNSGCIYTTSNETNGVGVWQFDVVASAWTQFPSALPVPVQDPLLVEAGGQLMVGALCLHSLHLSIRLTLTFAV